MWLLVCVVGLVEAAAAAAAAEREHAVAAVAELVLRLRVEGHGVTAADALAGEARRTHGVG